MQLVWLPASVTATWVLMLVLSLPCFSAGRHLALGDFSLLTWSLKNIRTGRLICLTSKGLASV